MIIDFSVSFNSYKEKILNKYDFFQYKCPNCGSTHSFSRHATYQRNISFLLENKILNEKLEILRLKCTSCKTTHAILPNDIVPYCIYSYSFIMNILLKHFVDKESVLSISSKYDISFQLIYFFFSKFKAFFNECIYVLRLFNLLKDNFNPSFNDILIEIINNSSTFSFLEIFFSKTKWMFLMKKFLNIIPKPIYIGSYDS